MMNALLDYFKCIAFAGIVLAIFRALVPQKGAGRVVGFVCGLVFLIVLLRPVARFDASQFAAALSKLEIWGIESRADIHVDNQRIMADIIKERTEAYIWDKATALRIPLQSVVVEVDKGGEYPIPDLVTISGAYTHEQRIQLTLWIEENLAISGSRQNWILE